MINFDTINSEEQQPDQGRNVHNANKCSQYAVLIFLECVLLSCGVL